LSFLVSTARQARCVRRLSGAGVVRRYARGFAAVRRGRSPIRSGRAGVGRRHRSRCPQAHRLGRRRADHGSSRRHCSSMQEPTLKDAYAARPRVYRVVKPTPLMRHALLSAETGLDLYVKHENHNPTGAFKIRGGLNLIASLSAEERRGVITASTGNHGQSIAYASQREGVPCTIVVPRGNNPEKNAAMRALGAEVIEFGRDFDEAREKVEQMRVELGLRYIHTANEPPIVAGVATYALEIFEAQPDTDVIFVPIGGRSR